MTPGDPSRPAAHRRRRRHAWGWALSFLVVAVLATLTVLALARRYGWASQPYVTDVRQLGAFEFDARRDGDDAVPADRRVLDGRRVVVIGEMYAPGEASTAVRAFQIVNEGAYERRGPPRVQNRVFATVPTSMQVANMTGRAVEAHGTLRVRIRRDENGEAISMFTLEVDRVNVASTPAPSGFGTDPLLSCFCTTMVSLGAGAAGWALWLARRRDRLPPYHWPGRCVTCGYDLRGSTERCPECGTFFGRRETT